MDKHYFTNDYLPKMHRIGKITGILGVFASFLPALVLGFGHGLWPDLALLATCFITVTTSFGFLWVIEPISYYPVLGPVGTYMAFLSGNISNMRVPCASIAQVSAGVELGSEQGSIISTIGMGVSIIINIIILSVGVIAGSSILAMLPPSVTAALNYLLPALFGALFVQFAVNQKKLAVIMLVFGCVVYIAINKGVFNFLPGASSYLGTLLCVFGSIFIAMAMKKMEDKKTYGHPLQAMSHRFQTIPYDSSVMDSGVHKTKPAGRTIISCTQWVYLSSTNRHN